MIGTVKWFDANKGFGFLTSPAQAEDIFVHWSTIAPVGQSCRSASAPGAFRSLNAGDEVTFRVELDQVRQRQRAVDVTVTRPAPARPEARHRTSSPRNAFETRYSQHA